MSKLIRIPTTRIRTWSGHTTNSYFPFNCPIDFDCVLSIPDPLWLYYLRAWPTFRLSLDLWSISLFWLVVGVEACRVLSVLSVYLSRVCVWNCERLRLKARHGVKIIGAKSTNTSLWQITLDLSHKLHGAVVSVSIVDPHSTHFPSDR